jgi:hypothetical protein
MSEEMERRRTPQSLTTPLWLHVVSTLVALSIPNIIETNRNRGTSDVLLVLYGYQVRSPLLAHLIHSGMYSFISGVL